MDRPREFALQAVPDELRPALRALWEIDLAFASVAATTIMPQLGAIRLAWWRERLEELDSGVAPPAEPRLQAVATDLIPQGVTGAELSRLEDCWLVLLNPYPWGDAEVDAVAERGVRLFGIGAQILGGAPAEAEPMGAIWSLADAAQGVSDAESRAVLRERVRSTIAELPRRRPSGALAPLTMIAHRRVYDLFHGDRKRWHRIVYGLRCAVLGRVFP